LRGIILDMDRYVRVCILDFYTDEPSGLSVPPYVGTYQRYAYGALSFFGKKRVVSYLTVDDLRNLSKGTLKGSVVTDIKRYNLTKSASEVEELLLKADVFVIIQGILTPGKYLRAYPGSIKEAVDLTKGYEAKRILFGPSGFGFGSGMQGGKLISPALLREIEESFDCIITDEDYEALCEAVDRAQSKELLKKVIVGKKSKYSLIEKCVKYSFRIVEQIPWETIFEIESYRGCAKAKACSFCTEKIKNPTLEYRDERAILEEIKLLNKAGANHFRIGKQSCFYSYKNMDVLAINFLLKESASLGLKTLHIDNANPIFVATDKGVEITKAVCKYCTAGNVAAFGVESVHPEVILRNNLGITKELCLKAIKIINKYGSGVGKNGAPLFLPGINILLGLIHENKEALDYNYEFLKEILESGLLLRRINIREVVPYPRTMLYEECKNKYLRKNRKYYYSWKRKVRVEIDNPMLQRVFPKGTILRDVLIEKRDGNNYFGRQFGTYPIIVGTKEKVEIGKKYDFLVVDYMLRSLVGEVTK